MAPYSRVKQAVSEGLEAGGTRICVVQPGIVIQITRFFLPAHRLITKMKMLRGKCSIDPKLWGILWEFGSWHLDPDHVRLIEVSTCGLEPIRSKMCGCTPNIRLLLLLLLLIIVLCISDKVSLDFV